ncbi:class I SAM-dependent methyltransferase [Bifidobacterium choladohabitans]|uniref:class I SAM-dependent methyltransferase n=1 Tax=Bifidobacterium choladohabitans TaxID=2750947 RepID=UPI0018DCB317|nr:class I SAM-dependent methyltransferase [Bifidobacterium choladohabitans]
MSHQMHQNEDVEDNLLNWNDRAVVHANGGYGDLDAFADDPSALSSVTLRDLEVLKPHLPGHSIKGLHLLHLQCHIGSDTISWWRLGARDVYGLDFSPTSLDYARKLSERAGASITYVQSDARCAADAMPEQKGSFDVIVTSCGTITWLPDLKDWARSIASLLADGGIFMIRDNHPLLFALNNEGMSIVQDYFGGTETTYETDQSYTSATDSLEDGAKPQITHTTNHNWAHDFQEISGALLDAGLTIEAIGEHNVDDWQSLPMLEYSPDLQGWIMPHNQPQIPLTFSMVARKKV